MSRSMSRSMIIPGGFGARVTLVLPGMVLLALLSLSAHAGIGDADPSFGIRGKLDLPAGFGGLARLPDGTLQVVAVEAAEVRVRRVTADGQAHLGFGLGGELRSPLAGGPAQVGRSVALPDGSVLLVLSEPIAESEAGWILPSPNPGRVLKLGADGRPDPGFGSGGLLWFPAEGHMTISTVQQLLSLPDGTLYVSVAYYYDYYECETGFSVHRFDAMGVPDRAFGTAGSVTLRSATCYAGGAPGLIPLDGGSVYVGYLATILDRNGRSVELPARLKQWLQSMGSTRLQWDGKAIHSSNVSGFAEGKPRQLVIARWNADLTLDLRYGAGEGFTTIDLDALPGFEPRPDSTPPQLYPAATQPFLYVSYQGYVDSLLPESGLYVAVIARLDADGNLDPGFGRAGIATASSYIRELIEQPDGGVVLDLGGHVIRLLATDDPSPGILWALLSCDRPYAVRVEESQGLRTQWLIRQLGNHGEQAVDFRLLGGSASLQDDLEAGTPLQGTLYWEDGQSGGLSFSVTPQDDALPEGDETFDVQFDLSQGDASLLCSRVRFLIPANDQPSSVPLPPGLPGSPSAPPAGGGALSLFTLLLFSMPLLAMVRLRRSSDMGAPVTLVPWLLMLSGLALASSARAGVGDIDPSYGSDGILQLTPPREGLSWAVLPDGRLLSAQVAEGSVRLSRYDGNGRSDAGFGTAGEQTVQMPAVWTPGTIAGIQGVEPVADGSIYLALYQDRPEVVTSVGKITSQGVLDTRFGQDGWLRFPASAVAQGASVAVEAIAAREDGGVALMLRYWQAYCGLREVLLQLRPDGLTRDGLSPPMLTPDPFTGPGARICYDYEPVDLRQLSSGQLRLASGWDSWFVDADGQRTRLGVRDLPGDAYYDYSNNFPLKIEPAADREFDYVLRESPVLSRVELVRMLPDGTLDGSFGGGGRAIVDFLSAVPALEAGDTGFFGSPVFFSDGFVEAAGGSGQFIYVSVNAHEVQPPGVSVLVARLHRDGRLDEAFGRSGFVRISGLHSGMGVAAEQIDGSALLPLALPDASAMIRLQGTTAASPGLILLAGSAAATVEGETATAHVSRSLGSLGAVSVRYRAVPGTAAAQTDFTSVSGTLNWADGDSDTKRIEIPILLDQQAEGEEAFSLVIEGATGGPTLLNPAWQVRIHDRSPQYGQPAPSANHQTVTGDAGGGGSLGVGSLALLLLHLVRRMRRSCPATGASARG